MKIEEQIKNLLKAETFSVAYSPEDETTLLNINTENGVHEYSLSSKKAVHRGLKIFWNDSYQERLSDKQIDEILEILEMKGYKNPLKEKRAYRIYNEEDLLLVYQLNTNDAVWIDVDLNGGKPFIDRIPSFIFRRTRNFQAQCSPDLTVNPKMLMKLMKKHFHLSNRDDEKLLAIYIISCFLGMSFHHPLLFICAEKGAGKSLLMKKIQLLADPQKSGVTALPKSADGLSLRLENSYLSCFDNLSCLSKSVSDKLCMAVTGAADTDRALFMNKDERITNLHSIVILTSTNVVIRASDLLDRTQIIRLKRLKPSELKTESEIWKSYHNDLPRILGGIFNTIARVIADDKPVHLNRKIRLADYHVWAVRIGRVLGISQQEVTRLLFENKSELNKEAIDSSSVALAVIELMKSQSVFRGTPTQCLAELKQTAKEMGMDAYSMPKDAARLTMQLEKVKTELEGTFGITFERERGKERSYVIRKVDVSE